MVRVRFAPSPTGNLHIGGARTALFNWLYARAQKGSFILRVEDTDVLRSKKEFVDEILESLNWLGFHWDEIYFQSQRIPIYREYATRLLGENKAYLQTTEGKGQAIVFKVTAQRIKVNDLIRGEIEFDTNVIKDQVIIKSDGTPTYNFACVVDDYLMGITHIIRGDDHISNTPKQILLYQAFEWKEPFFAHLPLIMGVEGGRLSKRTGATAISEYRRMGYLAEALVNYLLLLSWSPKDDREVIPIEEAIGLFDIRQINKSPATFDPKKLDWINNQYIRKKRPEDLADSLMPFLIQAGLLKNDTVDREYLLSVVRVFQNRINRLKDFVDWADYFFLSDIEPEPLAKEKYLNKDLSREFSLFIERLDNLQDFNPQSIEQAFRDLLKELNLDSKALIHPIRVAITGKTVGLGLFETIYYLGKERTKKRLLRWVERRG